MVIGRLLGWLLLLAALAVLGRDLIAWHASGHFVPISAGQLWYDLDRGSLGLAQAAVERHAAWLWTPVIATILRFWAVLVLAVPGLLLLWACRRRGYTRRRRWH